MVDPAQAQAQQAQQAQAQQAAPQPGAPVDPAMAAQGAPPPGAAPAPQPAAPPAADPGVYEEALAKLTSSMDQMANVTAQQQQQIQQIMNSHQDVKTKLTELEAAAAGVPQLQAKIQELESALLQPQPAPAGAAPAAQPAAQPAPAAQPLA